MSTYITDTKTLIHTLLMTEETPMTEEETRAKKDFERHSREEERDLERQKRFLQPVTFGEILATALAEPDPDVDTNTDEGC